MLEPFTHLIEFPTVLFTVPLAALCAYWSFVILGLLAVDAVDGGLGLLDADHDGYPDGFGAVGSFAGMGRAPLVVLLSLFVLPAWTISYVAAIAVGPTSRGVQGVLFGVACAVGLAAVRVGSRWVQPIFRYDPPLVASQLPGRTCRVASGRVDPTFGAADVFAGGSALRIDVRCDLPNVLAVGSEARIVAYDTERAAWIVEPLADEPRPPEA